MHYNKDEISIGAKQLLEFQLRTAYFNAMVAMVACSVFKTEPILINFVYFIWKQYLYDMEDFAMG